MKEQYLNNLSAHREVLQALPKNNNKDINNFNKKVNELILEYSNDMEMVRDEIVKRCRPYLDAKNTEDYSEIDKQLSVLEELFPIINIYNSSYEKSGLDKVLYNLNHYFSINLGLVNENIIKALDIFNSVGIILNIDNFSYSYYSNMYMNKFFSYKENNNIQSEEFKNFFEDIYWKCPNVISHITLNFKYLYYSNKKIFDNYFDTKIEELSKDNIVSKYINLRMEKDTLLLNNRNILLEKFLEGKLNTSDFDKNKIDKQKELISDKKLCSDNDIVDLSHSLHEYKEYAAVEYIITDIKKLYNDKDKYKQIYSKKRREIIKAEGALFKKNKKIIKNINKEKRFNYYNNVVNDDINSLNQLYDELEKNYFLEKVASISNDATILDLLNLASSNYNYLINLFNSLEKDSEHEISRLLDLIYYPYITIINNIWLNDDKDIPLIIMNKYNLCNFTLNKDLLNIDNIDSLITTTNLLINDIILRKIGLTTDKINFLKDAKPIFLEYK